MLDNFFKFPILCNICHGKMSPCIFKGRFELSTTWYLPSMQPGHDLVSSIVLEVYHKIFYFVLFIASHLCHFFQFKNIDYRNVALMCLLRRNISAEILSCVDPPNALCHKYNKIYHEQIMLDKLDTIPPFIGPKHFRNQYPCSVTV